VICSRSAVACRGRPGAKSTGGLNAISFREFFALSQSPLDTYEVPSDGYDF
jgi:hypothetical protein